MSSRSKVLFVVAAAGALGTGAVAVATSGADPPAAPSGRVVRLVEHQMPTRLIDSAPRGRVNAGDLAVVTKALFDEHGKRVGSLNSLCAVVGGGSNADVVCSGVASLRGGSLASSSRFHFSDDRHVSAVTGGTGVYAGARGWVESRTAPGGNPSINQDVVHLLP